MPKINVKIKGSAGEREAIKVLQPHLDRFGISLQRNLDQTRDGGYDLKGIPGMALEIKRQEKLLLPQWWKQSVDQADDGEIPVLMYRQNHKKWKVCLPLWLLTSNPSLKEYVELSIDGFISFLEEHLTDYLQHNKTA